MYNDKLHANLKCENRECYVSCTASYDSRDSKTKKNVRYVITVRTMV